MVLVLRCKVLFLVLNTRLGLGLERILFSLGLGLDLGLEKSLDYITASGTSNVISSAYLNIGLSFNLEK